MVIDEEFGQWEDSKRRIDLLALAQLSHFGGEIAIFKKSFLRSVSKSPKMLENRAW
jgi:hypothetical protein